MSQFPTLSKKEDSRYFDIEHEDPAVRSEMEGGYVQSRPRHTRKPRRTITTGFTDLPQADVDTLEAFWDEVKGGSSAFSYTLPTTGEILTVRFKSRLKPKYAGMGGVHRYNVSDIVLEEV